MEKPKREREFERGIQLLNRHINACKSCNRKGYKKRGGAFFKKSSVFVYVYKYLKLDVDILRHESDRGFLNDLKVPGAEDLNCQDTVRLVDSEALTKRL